MSGAYGPNRTSGKDTATTGADAVTVGTSSVKLADASDTRVGLYVSNDHATQVLYLGLGVTAVANKGIRVGAGQTIRIADFGGQVNAIASGASTVACIAEV